MYSSVSSSHPTLKPTDIMTYISGPIEHYGVYLGWHNGVELVFDNMKDIGERVVPLDVFLMGRSIHRIESTPTQNRNSTFQNIANKMKNPSKYNPLFKNCEQSAREVTAGKAYSKQVVGFASLAVVFIVAFS